MRRIIAIAGALALTLFLLVPAAQAAEPTTTRDSVLVAVHHDVSVPPGEHVDTLIVVDGTATVAGDVGTLVAVNGAVQLTSATVENVTAIRSPVTLGAGTTVSGDVQTFDSTVDQAATAVIGGQLVDVPARLFGVGLFLGPAILLFALGFLLAALVAGLALAAIAASQVRRAEALISTEPGPVLLAGIAGIVIPPILAILAMVTIIGAPLGLAILFGVWPLAAFLGYLIAGIWIGDWVLRRTSADTVRERPYLASIIGLVLLQVLSIVPFAAAIASLFGFGAVILLTWRVVRHREAGPRATIQPAPVASGA
jgi:hypothetical protein